MRKLVNRRTVIKGTAATLAVVTVGIPVLAKAEFDPAAYIAEADRCGFYYRTTYWQGSSWIGIPEPDEYSEAKLEDYMRLKQARDVDRKNTHKALVKYLRQVGRTY